MSTKFTRRDVGYTAISRFEAAFRSFLAERILMFFPNVLEGIPIGIIAKVNERSATASWNHITDLLDEIDFPDLKEIVCYQGMFSRYFPSEELPQTDFEDIMDDLYDLRCKIAHVKGYFTSLDLDRLIVNTERISGHLGEYGVNYLSFIDDLRQDPAEVIIPTPIAFGDDSSPLDRVPNNVPTPDYEYEGGFVGRTEDIRAVMRLLEGDLHRVITIAGAGGVGKTALALRVIQSALQKSNCRFDGVVWLSAKESKLSYLGIEDIEPSVKNYEQLLDKIHEVMGFGNPRSTTEEKEADVLTIFALHNLILIVIDNLETISDERIINFVIDTDPKVKILITSRKGLGQVERRYDLKQLKEKEAIWLFRQIARDKGLDSLAQVDDETLRVYVRRVSCYPLAIKWVIGQAAIGKDINFVIDRINDTTSDISRFCFEQIYHSLSTSAKKILCALSCFDESPSAGVLQYTVDINQSDFEDGIQELVLVSLIVPEPYKNESNEISRRYTLLSLTRGYVRQQLDKDRLLKRDIEERLRAVENTIAEAERTVKQYRYSLANFGAITEEEKVAAMLAEIAFNNYRAGRYLQAVEDYRRAVNIAPRLASLWRNWAVMEADEGHMVEADQLMEKAVKCSPKDSQLWLTWGNMKRKADKIKEALERYQKAYQLSPGDSFITNALGQARARSGEHEEADQLFRKSLELASSGSSSEYSVHHQVVNFTSLADNLRRWAEVLRRDRNTKEAEKKLYDALDYCRKALALDESDYRTMDLLRKILIELGYLYKRAQPDKAIDYFREAMMEKPIRYAEARDTLRAAVQVARIYLQRGDYIRARQTLTARMTRMRILEHEPKLDAEVSLLRSKLYPGTDG